MTEHQKAELVRELSRLSASTLAAMLVEYIARNGGEHLGDFGPAYNPEGPADLRTRPEPVQT